MTRTPRAAKMVETEAEDYTTFAEDLLQFSDQLLDDAKTVVRLSRKLRSIEKKWPKALQRVQGEDAERRLVEEAPELMGRIRLYAEMASDDLDFLLRRTQLVPPELATGVTPELATALGDMTSLSEYLTRLIM